MTDTLGILSDEAGIIPRALHALFKKLEADETESSVKCSFIELYNEELRDLISPDENSKLKIFDDNSKKGHSSTLVQGMEETHIKSATEGVKLLRKAATSAKLQLPNATTLAVEVTPYLLLQYTSRAQETMGRTMLVQAS